MSILTSVLPTELIINEKPCKIRTDFKTWLTFSSLITGDTSSVHKTIEMLKLIFEELPEKLEGIFEAVMDFYACGKESSDATEENHTNVKKKVFDFEIDADLIYAAFYQQYGIDLQNTNMHWWQFNALFNGLGEETHFIKVMGYRSINLSDVKNKDMKKHYSKLKKLYKLPDNRNEAQKETVLNDAFSAIF